MAYISFQPKDNFKTLLYSGTGAEHAITGVGFRPDLVWTKRRNSTSDHHVHDAIRGATYKYQTNDAGTNNADAQTLKSFDSDGFTLGTNTSSNASGGTYVSWNWKGANGTASNSNGSITSTVSANPTAGFSIVKWTGSGGNATIGHGLGKAPKWIWVKSMANSTWHMIYHVGTGNDSELGLNSNNAASGSSTAWQDTDPTSTVFYVAGGSGDGVNYSGDYTAYCWTDITGFSRFGKYYGNGNANGTFIHTGFKPAFVLAKYASGGGNGNWMLYDDKRGFNEDNQFFHPNSTDGESTSTHKVDLYANGFKWRANSSETNTSAGLYIYIAFAKEPSVSSNNIPATAR